MDTLVDREALDGVVALWHAQRLPHRLGIRMEAVPKVEITGGDRIVLDLDGVVRLGAEAGLGEVGAAGMHHLRHPTFDQNRELVVADMTRIVEQAILHLARCEHVQRDARVVILGIPDHRELWHWRCFLRIGIGRSRRRQDEVELALLGQTFEPLDELRIVKLIEGHIEIARPVFRAVHQPGDEGEDVAGQECPDRVVLDRNVLLQGGEKAGVTPRVGAGIDCWRLSSLYGFELLEEILR